MKPKLNIVIPCYNEESVLPITAPMFLEQLNKMIADKLISPQSKIMFVDDGSKDNTWNIISQLAQQNKAYIGIKQSRNRGHQNAVYAGLMESLDKCDITITIDCDGQDDMSCMSEMVQQYLDGKQIVYGVRKERKTDTLFKRFSAKFFYWIMNLMSVETIYNHADYRLMSNEVVSHLKDYKEVNLFLRGLVPLIGYSHGEVYYDREERLAGKSHYPLKKMLDLAGTGITCFSTTPIRMVTIGSLLINIISVIALLVLLVLALCHVEIALWVTITSFIFYVGSLQLMATAVIGEYISGINLEVKNRPRYIISEKTYKD